MATFVGLQTDEQAAKRMRVDGGEVLSEADILQLVAQRESFRQARRFTESDAIREQLRSYGVELYDKEKEWRCRDGRRGTLFTAGPGECALSDPEIQERIMQREEARKSKDWPRADALRDELRSYGVEMDDKEMVWRTANGRTGSYDGTVPALPKQKLGVPAIRKLVAERERLRASMDFEAADELRRQLAQSGVEIFDNARIWRSSDGQQGVIITGGHEVDCQLTDQDIVYRVAQREEARYSKDFGQADAIRDELRQHGVELLDTQGMWCTTDGRQGAYPGRSGQTPIPAANTLALTTQTPQLVQMPVVQAVQPSLTTAGLTTGLTTAGLTTAGLTGLTGLTGTTLTQQVVAQQPAATGGRLPSSPVTSNPSVMTFSTPSIVALVSGRERAREAHDWTGADAIRSDLRAHGVDVWDNEKIWRANDGRHGTIAKLP